jgi:phytoene synthase
MPFATELPTPSTDLANCRRTLSGGSRSFWVASQLLPGSLRNAACGLYAFCREADDAIDEGDDQAAALVLLHQRLDRIYSGEHSRSATDRVMARVVAEHRIPRELLNALLEGFSWDASGRRYATLDEAYAYCARVASTVGVMMTLLMGVRDSRALARAADLGVAMQLTNICRDVGEDARAGRLYLPLDLLRQYQVDADQLLTAPSYSAALGDVVKVLLDDADRLYRRSESGVPSLPAGCRPGIYAARRLYASIGDRLRHLGYNSVDQRAIVGPLGKTRVLAGTLRATWLGDDQLSEPAIPACQFLIDAVTNMPATSTQRAETDSLHVDFYRRMLWILDLVAALGERPADYRATRGTQRPQ